MGERKNSKWYDKAFSEMKMYQVDYKSIGYFPMWKEILNRIDKKDKIIELGCGVGQFAHMIKDFGYTYLSGYDFSSVAIEKASKRVPEYDFYLEDLENIPLEIVTDDADVVIMCEFLEHIEDDISILKQINKRMIITLPNFDGTSHIRFFKTLKDVIKRYESILLIEECKSFGDHYLLVGKCQ